MSVPNSNTFTADQQVAFDHVKAGASVFITGPAGSGKSFLIRAIQEFASNINKNAGITATTGNAAVLLEGRTIYSFLGIGLATEPAAELASKVMKNRQLFNKLRKLHMLIIDEISMLPDDILDKINEYLSIVRKTEKPFGGVQMILVGDPCQLPPVKGKFFFLSNAWAQLNPMKITLTTIVRQEKDQKFKDMLNRLRWGECSKSDKKALLACKETFFSEFIKPTRLFAINSLVDQVNAMEFDELLKTGAKSKSYATHFSSPAAEKWARSSAISPSTTLADGAQVVITFNIKQQEDLVNGTRGMVISVHDTHVAIATKDGRTALITYCEITNEDPSMVIRFMPLKLAYALTIHKSQGMTLDAVEIDLGSSIFEYGQAYTALSRVRDLSSVRILNIKARSFKTHPAVLEFYKN